VQADAAAASPVTLDQFQTNLATALTAVQAQDEAGTENAVLAAIGMWPAVEGTVAATSPDAYTAIEAQLANAGAALREEPVNWQAAQAAVVSMQLALEPISGQQTYTIFDAAVIIFREGLEALLIVAALLAVLRRSNNQDKQAWIWGGAALGILISIGAAFALQAVFSQVTAGQNRELIEGVTSLVAAGLLLYVSYWLHTKASLSGWQRYINQGTAQALARGNLIGLGLLALLAVFREGAETTVFYLGMAPSIAASDLLLGIAIGVALLAVAAWLMLVAGVRLPLRLFFRVAGILVFYLGFKFVGTGIHNLQVAGVVPVTPIPYMQPIGFLGIYPTWETLIPQLLMLGFAVAMTLHLQAQERRVKVTAASASA
jgi:high-affinity iron transporter